MNNAAPAVIARDVTKLYGGERPTHALGPVDITIPRGSVVALVGASGSGKSTLLHLLAGLSSVTSGSLEVMGTDVTAASRSGLGRMRGTTVSIVFQDFYLDSSKTALENVALPLIYQRVKARERRERASSLLSRVGLSGRVEHRPTQLSGGEKQRVAIARALVTSPGLLLADEPTGNLDSTSEGAVLGLMLSLAREDSVTVVIATHSPRVAAAADAVITLEDGHVAD